MGLNTDRRERKKKKEGGEKGGGKGVKIKPRNAGKRRGETWKSVKKMVKEPSENDPPPETKKNRGKLTKKRVDWSCRVRRKKGNPYYRPELW